MDVIVNTNNNKALLEVIMLRITLDMKTKFCPENFRSFQSYQMGIAYFYRS